MTHPPDGGAHARTPPPVAIRRTTPADAADVAAVVGEIADPEDQSAHVHISAEHWRRLLDRPHVIVLLAERAGQAVGCVSAPRQLHLWTGGDVLDLDDLHVRPGHRETGVGRQLMSALAAPGQLLISWGTGVDNVDAQRSDRRLGATLRPKALAAWTPAADSHLASARPQPEDR